MTHVTLADVVVGDEPGAWRSAGFTVDDDGTCRVGATRIRLVGRDQGKRILRWSLRGALAGAPLDRGDDETFVDGIPTTLVDDETDLPCAPASHANGVVLIDHIVLFTPDVARTVGALASIGLDARRTRHTDTYGAPFVQTFFRAGEVVVELIGPEEPAGDGPAGFYGLAYTVRDLPATAASLADHVGNVKDAVQPGRRIVTLRHKELDMSVATAFMSAETR